eukprot:NODE_9644_length_311_cov_91.881679_g7876_i0.p2 GENE.NODE_9644_length_311_cov_91.881679_g7876_i0~~NODE_9644_length_311_cov_91.881679_g7876_i0.p2  ORF type:complete len:58 (-),score=24.92 NODE_9644_length_311_cov_91.881679_g7876_i0:103-276(-)
MGGLNQPVYVLSGLTKSMQGQNVSFVLEQGTVSKTLTVPNFAGPALKGVAVKGRGNF